MSNIIQNKLEFFKDFIEKAKLDYKQYQADGLEWVLKNELKPGNNVVRGGFIADEMGLGKTILMIGTMLCNFVQPTIVIVPPILINQWFVQIYKTTSHKAIIYHGANKKTILVEDLGKAKIVITSYNSILLNNKNKNILHQIKWGRIIFDEGHHLRNSGTSLYRCAKMLKSNIRWLVSGTPVQNSKSDFYSLCSIIGLPASYYTNSDNLKHLARNFILKRTKKQVGINMSQVILNKNIVHWKNKKEMNLSQEIHSTLQFSNVSFANSKLFQYLNIKNTLKALLCARQSCILPKLLKKHLLNKQFEGIEELKEALHSSSKLDFVVNTILNKKHNGCGKLVFCQFRDEIDVIASKLKSGGIHKIGILDGRVTNKLRNVVLNQLHEVLILQIQTCCEGLNLQENYSEIYFVSPHWNPAIEDQAIARCHRIGQLKNVFVHRFEMDTFYEQEEENINIDKYIDHIQENKRIIASECIA